MKQKNVYLSVDLDYWYSSDIDKSINFIKKLLILDRPTTVFTEHHLVLREIKKQYKKIYNIDFHSDISDPDPGWPRCGKWVNYVYGRENAEYEWRLPCWDECVNYGYGLCHTLHKEYCQYNPFLDNNLHSWKNIKRKEGLKDLPLDDIDKISLVLSPEWSYGKYISHTLLYLIELEKAGQVKFYGRNVKPLIKRMITEGGPFENWY